MAYTAVVTAYLVKFITNDPTLPPEGLLIKVAETDVAKGVSTLITGIPRCGRLIRVDSTLVSGAGTNISPTLSTVMPDGTSTVTVWTTFEAAATVHDFALAPFLSVQERMTHAPNVDAGADNVVTTWYYFVRDWT